MSVPLPNELQGNLSCSSCGYLISVGPVTKSFNGWQCGRCSNEDGEQNVLYETLAGGYLFPCKYKSCGCDVLLSFGAKIKEHEFSCTKKPHICPTLASQKCEWQGHFGDIEEHFTKVHKECVLRDLKVEVDLSGITEKRYAYFHKNRISFLIDLILNKDKVLSVELIRVWEYKSEDASLNEKYDVAFHHRESKSIFTRNLSNYFWNINTLKIANNNIFDTIFLNYIGAAHKKVTLSFEAQLPAAPLSLTSQDRSLPTTQDNFICACKNIINGCEYMDNKKGIQEHESTCIVYDCPEKNEECKWRGVMSALLDHCYSKHVQTRATYPVDLKQIWSLQQTTRFYLFAPSTSELVDLFRICIKLEYRETTEPLVLVVVQCIDEAVRAKDYVFNIHFKKYRCKSLVLESANPRHLKSRGLHLLNAPHASNFDYSCRTKSFPCVPFTSDPAESVFKHSVSFCYEHIKECKAEFNVICKT